MQQGERSVTDFFTDIKSMWDELDNLKPLPNCRCAAPCQYGGYQLMRNHRERDHIIRFLKGLNEQYSHVRSRIMLIDPLPNVNRVFSMVVQQERQMLGEGQNVAVNESKMFASNSNTVADMNARRSGFPSRGRGRGNYGQGRGYTKICTFCGRQNHTVDTCYRKHGFPPGFKPRNAANCVSMNDVADTSAQDQEEMKDLVSMTHKQYDSLLNALHSSKINTEIPTSSTNMIQTSVLNAASNYTSGLIQSPFPSLMVHEI
ncbi:uncharacterized protein LOC133287905 [Gastrolobium bilobum]|uniref:uncharacterized protein LOC133287905 n=1 Tax=Gastrolobium bilobum TaxID=150636 RepID=UPI002AAF8B40|nr:uncharacterized protein LOC133287905 [Gastrolobium bilobum]